VVVALAITLAGGIGLLGLALAVDFHHTARKISSGLARWRDAFLPIDSTPFTTSLTRIWGFSIFTLAADAIAQLILPTTGRQVANAILGPSFVISWILPYVLNFRHLVWVARGSVAPGWPLGPRFRFAFLQLAAGVLILVLPLGLGAAMAIALQPVR
jgi:hypothetical protein